MKTHNHAAPISSGSREDLQAVIRKLEFVGLSDLAKQRLESLGLYAREQVTEMPAEYVYFTAGADRAIFSELWEWANPGIALPELDSPFGFSV